MDYRRSAEPTGKKQSVTPFSERHPAASGPVAGRPLLEFQQAAGNQAVLAALSSASQPLDAGLRHQMESLLGADFRRVRVHAGGTAAASAALLGATAYTSGEDIVLGRGAPDPDSAAGRQLLAHELTHVAQQRRGADLPGGIDHPADAYEAQAREVAGSVAAGRPPASTGLLAGQGADGPGAASPRAASPSAAGPGNPPVVQRQEHDVSQVPGHPGVPSPEEFIAKYRRETQWKPWRFAPTVAERLYWLMWQGEDHYPYVRQVLEALRGDNLDDDVASAMILGAHAEDLDKVAASPAGRALLDSMFEHVTSGYLSGDDEQAARLILQAKVKQVPVDTFVKDAEHAQVFPVRQMGWTVFDDSPLEAELLPNGNIRVKLPTRVLGSREFAPQVKRLPIEVFIEGEELRPDQLVGIRDYDLNDQVEYFPASALLLLSSKTFTSTWGSIANTVFLGATLGAGAEAEAGTWLARALVWADRAAAVISTVGTIINEHRRWAVQTFGERFVRAVDIATNVVAVYGAARLVHATASGGIKLVTDIKDRWRAIRAARNFAEIEGAAATKNVVADLDRAISDLPDPPAHEPPPAAEPTQGQPAGKAVAHDAATAGDAAAPKEAAAATPEKPTLAKPAKAAKPARPAKTAKPAKAAKAAKPNATAKAPKAKSAAPKAPKLQPTPKTPKTPKAKPAAPKAPKPSAASPKSAPPKSPKAPGAKPSGVPPIEDRVLVGAPNPEGQATFVTGELHPSDLHTGTPTGGYYPPGASRGELKGLKAVRGHLLGDLFGGKGTEPGNLVWLHEWVNNSPYKIHFENPVRAALQGGESVRFDILPHFEPGASAPYAVDVWAATGSGKVIVPRQTIRTPGMSHLELPPVPHVEAADLPVPPNQVTPNRVR